MLMRNGWLNQEAHQWRSEWQRRGIQEKQNSELMFFLATSLFMVSTHIHFVGIVLIIAARDGEC